jgi:hypothetical protein
MTEVNLKAHDSAGHGESSGAFSTCKIAAQVVQKTANALVVAGN